MKPTMKAATLLFLQLVLATTRKFIGQMQDNMKKDDLHSRGAVDPAENETEIEIERERGRENNSVTSTRMHYVSCNTDQVPRVSAVGNFPEQVLNLCEGKQWHGYKTKLGNLASWLSSSSGPSHDDLVVFMDGSDVIWGGCTQASFIGNYRRIVKEGGAEIVFSAELKCWENDCRLAQDMKRNSTAHLWKGYTGCPKDVWTEECAKRRGPCAACSKHPDMEFLNSGFVMGPAMKLREMVLWALDNYEKVTTLGDQSVFAVYWLQHPEMVQLDYKGKLALSLTAVSENAVTVQEGTIMNNVFGHQQCFIHGNGGGEQFGERLTSTFEKQLKINLNQVARPAFPDTESLLKSMAAVLQRERTPEIAKTLWYGQTTIAP